MGPEVFARFEDSIITRLSDHQNPETAPDGNQTKSPGGGETEPGDVANLIRFRRRLRSLRDRYRVGTVSLDDAQTRIRAWIAHAEHADSWRLRQNMFREGAFAPPSQSLSVAF